MTPSQKCYDLIKHFEGCRLAAYRDSGGIWTIGWGATHYPDGSKVRPGDTIDQAQADALLSRDVRRFSGYVDNSLDVSFLNQNQYDALTSFCYNRGPGNMDESRVFQLIKQNPCNPLIRTAFLDSENVTDHAGKRLDGLISRRKSEAWLYRYGEIKFF